jgi:hypothetical protein
VELNDDECALVLAGLFELRITCLESDAACAQIDDLAEKLDGEPQSDVLRGTGARPVPLTTTGITLGFVPWGVAARPPHPGHQRDRLYQATAKLIGCSRDGGALP